MLREGASLDAYTRANQYLRQLRKASVMYGLTAQQVRTLRGQALSGDLAGADSGLRRLIREAERRK